MGEMKPVRGFKFMPLQCFDLQQSFNCADFSLCFSLAALRFRLREIEDVILPKKCKGAGIKINPAQETLRCKRQMTSCDQGKGPRILASAARSDARCMAAWQRM